MGLSKQPAERLGDAMLQGNLDKFRRLLEKHPNEMRSEDGEDYWLHTAAGLGLLPFVELLVEIGIGVNESNSENYPHHTAVCSAASAGHLEIVRWLLDHDARINWTIDGESKCPALLTAVSEGHFEIVKLLVEHGADIHAHQAGVNPVMWAEWRGRKEIEEYLRSLGAKSLFETVPRDFPACHREIRRVIAELHGPLSTFEWRDEGNSPIVIYATLPKDAGDQVAFTVGLSDVDLNLPDGGHFLLELRLVLPHDWPLSNESMKDPEWNWPILWMNRIARQALESRQWSNYKAAIFMNGDPPTPLAENTKLNGWIALSKDEGNYQMPDYRWMDMRDLIPIYDEERLLIDNNGRNKFIQRLHDRNVPMHLLIDRPNVAK